MFSPLRSALAVLVVFAASMACSSPKPDAAQADGGSATPDASAPEPAAEIAKKDLGASCTLGCTPGVACANVDPSCPLGHCALDTRPGASNATYCTAVCNDNCPEGYTCEDVEISSERVCVAKHGTCGDGEIQGQEICDDSNTKDFDACSKDCKQGAPTYRASFDGYEKTDAILPAPGGGDGCGAATVAEANGYLTIRATSCDAARDKRMVQVLRIKNAPGNAAVAAMDIGLEYSAKSTQTSSAPVDVSCAGSCGVSVSVDHAWGSPEGFLARIDVAGLYRSGASGVDVRVGFKGSIAIVPPSAL